MFNGGKYLQIDNSTTSADSRASTMYSTASRASNMSSTASSAEEDWDNLQGYCLQRQYLGKYSHHTVIRENDLERLILISNVGTFIFN